MRSGSRSRAGRPATGFTYVVALFMLAVTSAAAGTLATIYSTEMKRRKEAQLLWVGEAFREAIGTYYQRSPGNVPRYPSTLEELLEDRRYLSLQRYLRRIYADPMTGQSEWGTVPAPGGGIMGVYSLSTTKPLKQARFSERMAAFNEAASYRDWKFVYVPPQLPSAPSSGKVSR